MTTCSYEIRGPKVRRLLSWRRKCKRRIPDGERYCWQHKPMNPYVRRVTE